jgi:hypothetical protein
VQMKSTGQPPDSELSASCFNVNCVKCEDPANCKHYCHVYAAKARLIANALLMEIACPKNSSEIFTIGGSEIRLSRVTEIIQGVLMDMKQ